MSSLERFSSRTSSIPTNSKTNHTTRYETFSTPGPHNLEPIDHKIHVHYFSKPTKTFTLHPKIGIIKQVLVQNRTLTLYLITEDGLLYRSKYHDLELVHPFDGSTSTRAELMAFYTDAILFVGRDEQSYKIFGLGENSYFRITQHACETDTQFRKIQIAFDVSSQTNNYPDTIRTVTHIGCCFSFSCCVVNGIYVHMCGQNWMEGNVDLVNRYHCWSRLLQKMDVKVSKMECGDFHVVLLHEDGSISFGGRDLYNSSVVPPASVVLPFSKVNMNHLKASNVFSGSNSFLVVFGNGLHQYFGDKTSGQFTENGMVKITDRPEEKITEISHCPDYVIFKLLGSAHILYLKGKCYFDGEYLENKILDLRTIIPRNNFANIRGTEEVFYKEHVKYVALAHAVVVCCNKNNLYVTKFMNNLFALNDTTNEKNWAFYDISILH